MRTPTLSRYFALAVALQFTHVQVHTAFGTEAIGEQNPEVRHALSRAQNVIEKHLSGMSERGQLRMAYRLYKKAVAFRNRVYTRSPEEIQKRVRELETGGVREAVSIAELPAEDQVLLNELDQDQQTLGLREASTELESTISRMSARDFRKDRILQASDELLMPLGTTMLSSGMLKKASRDAFETKVKELQKLEGRAPASSSFLVKVILALLILGAGLALLHLGVAILVLATWAGSSVGLILIGMILVAGLTVYGLIRIFRAEIRAPQATTA